LDYESEGRVFESRRAHQEINRLQVFACSLFLFVSNLFLTRSKSHSPAVLYQVAIK